MADVQLGKIWFAWVDPAEAFDAGVHAREDEALLSLSISQSERSEEHTS